MPDQHSLQDLREALSAIIEGRIVKRSKHDLIFEGSDISKIFIEELEKNGYVSATVRDIDVKPGERIPAFLIDKQTAFFGWVFWEQFSSTKLRKLWGSLIKNDLGDWKLQISEKRPTIIYANQSLKLEMDIERPPEF